LLGLLASLPFVLGVMLSGISKYITIKGS